MRTPLCRNLIFLVSRVRPNIKVINLSSDEKPFSWGLLLGSDLLSSRDMEEIG